MQSWRGKPFSNEEMRRFDLKNVLGAWCMLNVIERPGQDGKMYVNVSGVSPVPSMIKQAGLPQGVNPNEIFNLEDPDMELFAKFSDHLKKKIEASPEWQRLGIKKPEPEQEFAPPEALSTGFDDDSSIPF